MNTYTVPYTSFGAKNASIRPKLIAAFESVLDSGRYIMGPEVDAFQREFAAYCDSKFSIGLSTGLDALHLVLRALGVGEGDEVITVSNSFIATAASIALIGARPVFVDIRPDFNIDPEKIEASITPRTRAIVPVHLTGRPARMPEILAVAKAHDLFVVEDAAQAVGAKLDGKKVGSWGDAGCFSLHPLKNLHAIGDGGIMTTDRADLVEHVSKLRNHGLANRERCDFWGFNCRLDELQAALLRVQLHELDRWTEERRRLAFRYNKLLQPFVEVPEEQTGEYCVYQTYVVGADRRDQLQQYLKSNGVEALVHYPIPIHLQPAAKDLGYSADDFPVTARVTSRILSLPLYPGLTAAQQDQVVSLFVSFYKGA
jgi:dTDP-4-amino-4,6-dideoxygalactose transaminase